MKKIKKNFWFTLIEMIVSITIFSIIMVSIIMIYSRSVNISSQYDINRELRQNIKSLLEDIAEEVRKNHIKWVKNGYWPYTFSAHTWTMLKVWNIEYKLEKYKYDDLTNSDNSLNCSDIKTICKINKYKSLSLIWPLTNSKISFSDFRFEVSWKWEIPKVKINFVARPAVRAWISPEVIKRSTITVQTTFSERLLKVK